MGLPHRHNDFIHVQPVKNMTRGGVNHPRKENRHIDLMLIENNNMSPQEKESKEEVIYQRMLENSVPLHLLGCGMAKR